MHILSRLMGLVALTLVMGLPSLSVAANTSEDYADIRKGTARLQQEVGELASLDEKISSASKQDRDALVYRRDQRSFQVLQGIERLSKAVAALPEDDPQRLQGQAALQQSLGQASQGVLKRISEIGARLDSLYADNAGQSGAPLIAGEAYSRALQALRLRYYEALVEIAEARESLSFADEGLSEQFLPQLHLLAETLSGRLEFTGRALAGLKERKAAEKDNADLAQVIADLTRQQAADLAQLSSIIDLLERTGEDPVSYQAVMLEQGEGLSITTLESGAISRILDDGWATLQQSMVNQAPDFLLNLLIFIVILLVFRSLAKLARSGVKAACERPGVDVSTLLKEVLVSVCGGTVMVLGILIALAQVGISLGPMLAGLGVAGFVIGFALQDTLANFAAGGMILAYRPYDVDDFIEVAGASGLVKKMSLVSTTITTFDNQTLVVPNSKIWGDVIKNVTAQKLRRVDLVFGIGYGDDIPHAEDILQAVVSGHEKVLEKPQTLIKVHELADSSVNFAVRPWVRTEDYWDVYWDLTRAVKLRFDEEGISIPFPQRDVHFFSEGSKTSETDDPNDTSRTS